MQYCKNCGKAVLHSYCSHCGQKANLHRITAHYIWHEVFHFFTHLETGFLFTSYCMLTRPAKTVKDFIDGKRKTHQAPVSYFLIWITIYILFLYLLENWFGENEVINYKEYFGPSSTTRFAISHLSIVLTLVIPIQALYLYLLATKKNYNYFETLVATIYAVGTIILLQVVFSVIALIFYTLTGTTVDLLLSDGFKGLYMIWFVAGIVKMTTERNKLVRTILLCLLFFATFTVWRLYGFPGLATWFNSTIEPKK